MSIELKMPPNSLDGLREKIENGEELTEFDLKKTAQLQALDLVEIGRYYASLEIELWNKMLVMDEEIQEIRKKLLLKKVGLLDDYEDESIETSDTDESENSSG